MVDDTAELHAANGPRPGQVKWPRLAQLLAALSHLSRLSQAGWERILALVSGPPADAEPGTAEPGAALARVHAALKRPFAAVLAFSFVMNFLALTIPVYMSQLFDRVLTSFSASTLFLLTILALGLLRLFAVLDSLRAKIVGRVALKAEQTLAPALLAAGVNDQLGGRTDSSLAMRDLSALRIFASSPVLSGLFDAPLVPFYIAVTFLIHWVLGLITLAGALGMLALAAANQAATNKRLERASRAANALGFAADQQIRNADVIEAMGLMPALAARWRHSHDRALTEQLEANERGGAFQLETKYLRMAMQVIALGSGAALVLSGKMTPGMMFAASIILARGLQPIEIAVGSWRALLSARDNYRRIAAAFARLPPAREAMALPPPQGRVEAHAVSYAAGERQILRDVSFTFEPGDAVGIVGPAAAGKSTLGRVILGVWPASSGTVRLDGADILQLPRPVIGPYIGYLPQEVELFPGTVAENIARMGALDAEEIIAAARWAGLHETILQYPQGYDTRIMAGGLVLSPGQRQRIALARALYGSPKLLVLDEPNSNLDAEGEQALGAALNLAKERAITAIFITHRAGVLAHASKILVMRDGMVQGFGARDEVLKRLTQRPERIEAKVVPMQNALMRPGTP